MADNLNTRYLGQPTTSDNLNTPFVGTGSDTSEVEENPKIFTSEVTFETTVSLGGALNSASAISAGAITGTTGAFTSTLSSDGSVTFQGKLELNDTLDSASAVSAGAITGTTGAFTSTLSSDGSVTFQGKLELNDTLDSASAISAGEITATGGNFSSTITVTDGDFLSVNTQANSSGMVAGQLRLVFAASGVSLMYSSGVSEYIVNSAVSAAQS